MKKPETNKTNEGFQSAEPIKVEHCSVDHVRMVGKSVMFTMNMNGVQINNCRVVEGRNGDFISLPQYKGSNGNYYNTVWFKLSDNDLKKLLEMVEYQLNQ